MDDYKCRLYGSLTSSASSKNHNHEGAALFGFTCGNRYQPGCLTADQSARLHSCEHGIECVALRSPNVVYITPIITRSNVGEVLPEVGAGGGGGDLAQARELDLNDGEAAMRLIELCSEKIVDQQARLKTISLLSKARTSQRKVISLHTLHLDMNDGTMPLDELAKLLTKLVDQTDSICLVDEDLEEALGNDRKKTKVRDVDVLKVELPRYLVRTLLCM